MYKVKKAKKHFYLLLELLVAFFLLSLFLAPMLSSPFAFVRKQVRDMTTVYLTLEEEKYLALIEEDLRSGKTSWDTVLKAQDKPFLLGTKDITLPGDTHKYKAKLFLLQGKFETQGDLSFGTVKAAVKIYQTPQKKLKKKPASLTLFLLKKQTVEDHAEG
jgi:hypothetical protein